MAQSPPSVAQEGHTAPTEETPMHEAEGSSPAHADSHPSADSREDDVPSVQTLPTGNYFHPQNPAYLYLGCCRTDQSEIWLGMNRPKLPFQQLLHSFEFEKMPVETPEIDWIPEFQLHNFPGTTPEEQEKARRHHLDDIIHSNVASNEAIETILLVSASNRPDEPPCHIHLREEWTLSDLFDSAIDGCELRGQAPETVKSIQATFLWDDRRMQRLRKDRPDDWTIFWQALRRAWTQKRGSLTEHGCEIEMVVRVEEKGA